MHVRAGAQQPLGRARVSALRRKVQRVLPDEVRAQKVRTERGEALEQRDVPPACGKVRDRRVVEVRAADVHARPARERRLQLRAACPISTGWGTRRVRLVRGGGRGVSD